MIRCDSMMPMFYYTPPHMCLKVGHICDTISCLAWTTFVRCEDLLPFAAYGVQEFEKIVHGRSGAPGTDMGMFSLKTTASPADLILDVKNVCFLVSAFFQGR